MKGNDVRIGGERVGSVSDIAPVHHANGLDTALISMKLEKSVEPLPADSTVIVRSRSALGLKYVEITPGSAERGLQGGRHDPAVAGAAAPGGDRRGAQHVRRADARAGQQKSIQGFGDALAGRGQDLNKAIQALRPLFTDLAAGGRQPLCAADAAAPLLPRARPRGGDRRRRSGRRRRTCSPTWTPPSPRSPAWRARSSRRRSPRGRRRSTRSTRSCRVQRAVPRATAPASCASCGPAWRCCRAPRRCWPTRSTAGAKRCRRRRRLNRQLADAFRVAPALRRPTRSCRRA